MVDELGHICAVGRVVGGIVPPSDEEEGECREDDTNTFEPDPLAEAFLEERQQDTCQHEHHPDEEDRKDCGHLDEVLPVLVVHEIGDLGVSRIVSEALLREKEEEVGEEEDEEDSSVPSECTT